MNSYLIISAARRLVVGSRPWMSAIAAEAITEKYIPELEKRLEKETGNKAKALEKLIDEYRKYATPRTKENAMFDAKANYLIVDIAKAFGLDRHMAEDMAQDLAVKFYNDPKIKNVFNKFNPLDGPKKLSYLLSSVVRLRGRTWIRDEIRRNPMYHQREERSDLPEQKRAPGAPVPMGVDEEVAGVLEGEKMAIREIANDMTRFVNRKLRGDGPQLVFAHWLDQVKSVGPRNVKMNKVFDAAVREMKDRGMPEIKKSMLYRYWTEIKKAIARFFESELNVKLTPAMKSKLKIARLDEIVAHTYIRRFVASWVLGKAV